MFLTSETIPKVAILINIEIWKQKYKRGRSRKRNGRLRIKAQIIKLKQTKISRRRDPKWGLEKNANEKLQEFEVFTMKFGKEKNCQKIGNRV